jgi:hypothetical protein
MAVNSKLHFLVVLNLVISSDTNGRHFLSLRFDEETRQAANLWRKIEARSRNDFFVEQQKVLTYSECVYLWT